MGRGRKQTFCMSALNLMKLYKLPGETNKYISTLTQDETNKYKSTLNQDLGLNLNIV